LRWSTKKQVLGLEALVDRAAVLLLAEPEHVLEVIEHLALAQLALGHLHERDHQLDALLREDVRLLHEGGAGRVGRADHRRARARADRAAQPGLHRVDLREHDQVERRRLCFDLEQVVHVGDAHLRREARVDRAALGALLVQLLRREVRVDQVLRRHAQRLEVRAEERVLRVLVEHPRDADAQLGPLLEQREAALLVLQALARRLASVARASSLPATLPSFSAAFRASRRPWGCG
jgi:hypothetical protein